MRNVARRSAQCGLSLVELLVGSTIGLWLVCAALLLFTSHLRDNRRLLLEARLHQDLRTAADLLAHDLKRAGHWQHALSAAAPARNPYREIVASSTGITYSYSRDDVENDAVDVAEATGVRLSSGTLQVLIGGSWQALTEPSVLRVTALAVTLADEPLPDIGVACETACGIATAQCPRLLVRNLMVRLTAQSAVDVAVRREVRTAVRVRNDDVVPPACP